MEREALGTVLVVITAVVAIAAMVVRPVLLPPTQTTGLTSQAKDTPKDLGVVLTVSPTGPVIEGATVTLSATANKKIESVDFSAQSGSCTKALSIDTAEPYTVSWDTKAQGCGPGTYALIATATHASGKQETKTATITVEPVPKVYVQDEPSTISLRGSGTSSSSDVYPPLTNSAPGQNLVTFTVKAQGDKDKFEIHTSIFGLKGSQGTFNLNYRLLDRTTATVLAEGTILNPTTSTEGTLDTTLVIPSAQEEHELVLQFKSSQLFSAVTAQTYEVTVDRYFLQ